MVKGVVCMVFFLPRLAFIITYCGRSVDSVKLCIEIVNVCAIFEA
jgi:hypothetical protein